MAKKRYIESASVFERSGIRAIRVRAIEVLLYNSKLLLSVLSERTFQERLMQHLSFFEILFRQGR